MNAQSGTTSEQTTPAPAAPAEETSAAPAAAADATSTEGTSTQERDEAGKFRKPVQPRIDELTRKARENEREAAYWRARAEAKEAADAAANAPKKPVASDFESYDAYVEALAEFKADEKISKRLEEREKVTAEKQQAQTRATTWQQKVAEYSKVATDYHEVMSASDVGIAPHVEAALSDSDMGPQLAYHLAKNPDVAERLNGMSEAAANREIGKLEAKLSADTAPAPEPEETQAEATPKPAPAARAPKTTSAPPPARPLSSGRTTTVDLAKADMDEYVKTRRSQGARWAR